jgi:two-component system chemotaxis response regulator CheY
MSKKHNVVITDDEPHVRVFLRFAMNNMGLTVVGEAENGDQAVEIYRRLRPDLLLLDLNMPVKTGEAALREIRNEFPTARVVMLSSSADRESVEECAKLGAAFYIRKDCPFEEMQEILLSILEPDGNGKL